jgi:hypothetical protein
VAKGFEFEEIGMALRVVQIDDGKFLYRCDKCSYEFPDAPVKKQELGTPPAHKCQASQDADIYL